MSKRSDEEYENRLFRLLEMEGISEGGVRVAYVRLPYHEGLHPVIILDRDTTLPQIEKVWRPFVCRYRDILYARQPYELKWPESFYEDICALLKTEWADVRKGKIKTGRTSYADVAEGYNRLVETSLVAHVKYGAKLKENKDAYLVHAIERVSSRRAAAKLAAKLKENREDAYLEHAKSILEAFNIKDVGEFMEGALRDIRDGLSPVQREFPIDRWKVRYVASAWKKKRKRLDAVQKHG